MSDTFSIGCSRTRVLQEGVTFRVVFRDIERKGKMTCRKCNTVLINPFITAVFFFFHFCLLDDKTS